MSDSSPEEESDSINSDKLDPDCFHLLFIISHFHDLFHTNFFPSGITAPPSSLLSSTNVYLKINKTHMLQTSGSSTHNPSHKANTYGISLLNC